MKELQYLGSTGTIGKRGPYRLCEGDTIQHQLYTLLHIKFWDSKFFNW